MKAKVTVAAKEKALGSVYDPAVKILEPILAEQLEKNQAGVVFPNPNLVIRSMNRCRQASRPHNPKNLFISILFCIWVFFRSDVTIGAGDNRIRHLIFMTEEQITLLINARRLYIDGKFEFFVRSFERSDLLRDHLNNFSPYMFSCEKATWYPFASC